MEHERESTSKIAATQNIIKNKFKQAYSDRLAHEENVIRALKPLADQLSASSKIPTMNHAFEANLLRTNDINKLCMRLKKLIKSSVNNSDYNCNEELKSIIIKLREHEIIV